MSSKIKEILYPFQQKIEALLNEKKFSEKNRLHEPMTYAILNGGKRFRPALALMVAEALNKQFSVLPAALAIEYFHTASLIADDLPSMDNDEERRGKPSTHVRFGEAQALLASYALIAEGYQALGENIALYKGNQTKDVAVLALENAAYNTGISGATGGQFIDLFPPDETFSTYEETILKKTVSLFELSMVLGWLFGGGEIVRLSDVKKAAYHYGMAFQMIDDIDDASSDHTHGRKMNAVTLLGLAEVIQRSKKHLENYHILLKNLSLDSKELKALGEYLSEEMNKIQQ